MVNHVTFFCVLARLGMLPPRRRQAVPLFFLRPITQEIAAQMPNLFHRLNFGFIGGATFVDGLIHHIGDLSESRVSMRTLGKSRIETLLVLFWDGKFFVHSPP